MFCDLIPKFIWIESLISPCTATFPLQSNISFLIPFCSRTSIWTTAKDPRGLLSAFHPVYTAIQVINLKYELEDMSSLLRLFLYLIKLCLIWPLYKFLTSSLISLTQLIIIFNYSKSIFAVSISPFKNLFCYVLFSILCFCKPVPTLSGTLLTHTRLYITFCPDFTFFFTWR